MVWFGQEAEDDGGAEPSTPPSPSPDEPPVASEVVARLLFNQEDTRPGGGMGCWVLGLTSGGGGLGQRLGFRFGHGLGTGAIILGNAHRWSNFGGPRGGPVQGWVGGRLPGLLKRSLAVAEPEADLAGGSGSAE